MYAVMASAQQADGGWESKLHQQVKNHQLADALKTVDQRLAEAPSDLDAHGWRGRVLAWNGQWSQAETEYRLVLDNSPNDTDMLTALSDVLVWQQRSEEALQQLDQALKLSPSDPEILKRRARVLGILGRKTEARTELRQALALDPHDQETKTSLQGLASETKHEFRIDEGVDTFNYTDTAQTQSLSLQSRWTSHWSTSVGTSFYQRFGEDATKFAASAAYRFDSKDWLSVGGAAANDHGVIPKSEAFFEYGHGFRFHNPWVRGLEASYQQHWLWYSGAHVLTVGVNQIYYLPRDWMWFLTLNGARSGFAGTAVEWVPSGSSRLDFPLYRRLRGNVAFAVGSENYAQVDQIGRFAARTYAGGLRYRFTTNQDISGSVAVQDRSQGRSENSYGLSYGFRF